MHRRGIHADHGCRIRRVVQRDHDHVVTLGQRLAMRHRLRIERVRVRNTVVSIQGDARRAHVRRHARGDRDAQRLAVLVRQVRLDALEVREPIRGRDVFRGRSTRAADSVPTTGPAGQRVPRWPPRCQPRTYLQSQSGQPGSATCREPRERTVPCSLFLSPFVWDRLIISTRCRTRVRRLSQMCRRGPQRHLRGLRALPGEPPRRYTPFAHADCAAGRRRDRARARRDPRARRRWLRRPPRARRAVGSCREVADSTPDLIVLDWMLPGFDGLEVLRRASPDVGLTRADVDGTRRRDSTASSASKSAPTTT